MNFKVLKITKSSFINEDFSEGEALKVDQPDTDLFLIENSTSSIKTKFNGRITKSYRNDSLIINLFDNLGGILRLIEA